MKTELLEFEIRNFLIYNSVQTIAELIISPRGRNFNQGANNGRVQKNEPKTNPTGAKETTTQT